MWLSACGIMADKTHNGAVAPLTNNEADVEKQAESSLTRAISGPPYSIFTTWQKRGIVLGAALTAFFSPLTAQIYLPALNLLAHDLHVTNTQINLTITTYMIFQGITPMFIGSLADSGGRRPAYIACFVVYIAANIGLALAPSYSALLGLRCIQSAGSSSTVALCQAVVADVITSAERGQYIGFTSVPAVLATSLGPIVGGLLSQYLGWRAIFWFLAIMSGATFIVLVAVFPETCRHIVGDGSITPPPLYQSLLQMMRIRRKGKALSQRASDNENEQKFKFKAPNVLGAVFLLFEKETGALLWTTSIVFAGFYAVASAMPSLFASKYGYNQIEIALMYIPIAAGSVGAASIVGPAINKNYKRHCVKRGVPFDRKRQLDLAEFPIEKARLEIGIPLLCLAAVTIIGWSWAIDKNAHVAVPCVLSFLMGVGLLGFSNTTSILLVDVHPGRAGTATAANNLTRCLIGAGASAAIVPMMDAMGVGPAFTFIAALYFVCILPLLLLKRYGMKWRAELKEKADRKKKAKEGSAAEVPETGNSEAQTSQEGTGDGSKHDA